MNTLNDIIDDCTTVYMWIATTEHEGKYVPVDKEWMKRLIKDEFEGQIDFTHDGETNEIFFH